MRFLVVILAVLCFGAVSTVKHDTIDIDVTTIKASTDKRHKLPLNSGDDDDDGSTDIQADEASGSSGSGETTTVTPTTKKPMVKNTHSKSTEKYREKTTKMAKKLSTEHVEYTAKPRKTSLPTEKVVEVKRGREMTEKEVFTERVSTTNDDMVGGGVSGGDGDVAARKGADEAVQVLTTEVIAAVVVGGVCAIILIAFLVYRLRKRDEGSYILTDNAFKDTNKLRGDTGKEAFV